MKQTTMPDMSGKIIVIDAPAGAGASTTAKRLAQLYDTPYLDTGAIYRTIALAWKNSQSHEPPSRSIEEAIMPIVEFVKANLRFIWQPRSLSNIVYLGDDDITTSIRTRAVDERVAYIAGLPVVRESVRELQRSFAVNGIIAEGRDLGTAVFPDAHYKFFLQASAKIRAQRRMAELHMKGDTTTTYEQVLLNIVQRDHMDSSRDHSPMAVAIDAIVINTDNLSPEGVVTQVRAAIGTINRNRRIKKQAEDLVAAGF